LVHGKWRVGEEREDRLLLLCLVKKNYRTWKGKYKWKLKLLFSYLSLFSNTGMI